MDLSVGCDHPVRVAGMCAICGLAVDDDSTDSQTSSQLHDFSGVRINSAEAARLDSENTTRLLRNRKLALIVDLDQTIIHATVDPTVGEWMKDTRNPNFAALKDVGKFRLGTDGKAILDDEEVKGDNAANSDGKGKQQAAQQLLQDHEGCWYYVKPRPGLNAFLAQLGEKYEMYVYTMGTRSYAECVCKLVDPQGTLFGARILSRDENGSLLQKSLKKLFPMDTSMVVIIDDRADVWKWSPNLLKVVPFDFFVGIGDINASFLPAAPTVPAPTTENEEGSGESPAGDNGAPGEDKEGEQMAEAKEGEVVEGAAKQKEQEAAAVAEKSQKTAVSEQLGSRPLAKMQKALDGKTEQTNDVAAVLRDDDSELQRLREILDQVHLLWYQQWDASPRPDDKPAITTIIAALKAAVLADTTIIFSSVIPLQLPPATSDLWRLASEFGATCKTDLDETVTHVVAAKPDTQKVLMGQRRNLSVVWPSWLHDSCARWGRQPEAWYELPKSAATAATLASDVGGTSSESDQLLYSNDTDAPGDNGGDDEDDEQGFGEMNWDEANDEVDAALEGLTDDEDTTDEGGYTTDGSMARRRKRQRSANPSEADDANDVDDGGGDEEQEGSQPLNSVTLSPLSKRRKKAEMRVGQSKLKNVLPVVDSPTSQEGAKTSSKDDGAPEEDGDKGETGDEDDDFLQSLQDELELQLAGDDDDDGNDGEQGLASDDE